MKKMILAALGALVFIMAIPTDADAHRRWRHGYGYYYNPPGYGYYNPPGYGYGYRGPYYGYGTGGYGYGGGPNYSYGYSPGGVSIYIGPGGGYYSWPWW